MSAIELHDLHKSYGRGGRPRRLLRVAAGEVFCLLGPNGAGKTTTVEILEGYRLPDAGEVRVLGHDPARGERALRERIGIVLQQSGVQRRADGRRGARDVRPLLPAPAAARRGDRARRARRQARRRAWRRSRAASAAGWTSRWALIGDPDLLFLDEPTTGFDPHARRQAWATIRSLCDARQDGLPHHPLHGRGAGAGRPRRGDGARASRGDRAAGRARRARRAADRDPLRACPTASAAELPRAAGARRSRRDRDGVLVTTRDGVAALHALTGWALERGVALAGFAVTQPDPRGRLPGAHRPASPRRPLR